MPRTLFVSVLALVASVSAAAAQPLVIGHRGADHGSTGAAAALLRAFINQMQQLPASRMTAADRQRLVTAGDKILIGL